jgi:HSP20 family molecular chaperone IbpA
LKTLKNLFVIDLIDEMTEATVNSTSKGVLEAYVPGLEDSDFEIYLESAELYLKYNKITNDEEKKIHSCGASVQQCATKF